MVDCSTQTYTNTNPSIKTQLYNIGTSLNMIFTNWNPTFPDDACGTPIYSLTYVDSRSLPEDKFNFSNMSMILYTTDLYFKLLSPLYLKLSVSNPTYTIQNFTTF